MKFGCGVGSANTRPHIIMQWMVAHDKRYACVVLLLFFIWYMYLMDVWLCEDQRSHVWEKIGLRLQILLTTPHEWLFLETKCSQNMQLFSLSLKFHTKSVNKVRPPKNLSILIIVIHLVTSLCINGNVLQDRDGTATFLYFIKANLSKTKTNKTKTIDKRLLLTL